MINNQFATQFLLSEVGAYDSLRSMLAELGASQETIEMLVNAVERGILKPTVAIQIVKQTSGVAETSTVGGGTTAGASFTPGTGEQVATPKAFAKRKYQEDAPRLAGNPAKTDKQGTKNLTAYKNFGFTKAPNAEEAGEHIKGVDVKSLWNEEDELNESRAYSHFKKQTAIRSRDQQMHEAAKIISSKLEEVNRLLEFASQMKQELSEGEESLEYNRNTRKVFEKIHGKVVEVYSKVKNLK